MKKVDLSKLKELFNPFKSSVWVKLNSPITREEIKAAIDNGEFISPDEETPMYLIWDESTREQHAKRIAWLVENFSHDFPIEIDFGIEGFDSLRHDIVLDGCHRIAAAIYRGEKFIMANCSGSKSRIDFYTCDF